MTAIDKYLFCQCLYELENDKPRTIHCLAPCRAQIRIIEARQARKSWMFCQWIMKDGSRTFIRPKNFDDVSLCVKLITTNGRA